MAVILTADQARKIHDPAEVARCTCRLDLPCTCGLEAELIRLPSANGPAAGWKVQR